VVGTKEDGEVRVVIVGAGEVSVATARQLVEKGFEVVVVETDRARIDEISEDLDCSFLHGDGSRPDVLREVDPEGTDVLLCLTDSDQVNVIAGLVGRSLGFRRVVTSITDPQFEGICGELGLDDTIVPSRTISRYLVDSVRGGGIVEISTVIKDEARFFSFAATERDAGPVADLDLPEGARVICYYRKEKFALADPETKLHRDDEVVILTHSRNLEALRRRWRPKEAGDEGDGKESSR
jgi:trk/ktr system potassium uptake protein